MSQWSDWARRFNEAGALCRAAGIDFVFHNHDFEFHPIDGAEPYARLLEEIDPERVRLELDFYWMIKAGRDPEAYFKAMPGAYRLGHVKDMSMPGEAMADVGAGVIDFEHLLPIAAAAGMRHFFVEHDDTPDRWASAQASFDYLASRAFFAE